MRRGNMQTTNIQPRIIRNWSEPAEDQAICAVPRKRMFIICGISSSHRYSFSQHTQQVLVFVNDRILGHLSDHMSNSRANISRSCADFSIWNTISRANHNRPVGVEVLPRQKSFGPNPRSQ